MTVISKNAVASAMVAIRRIIRYSLSGRRWPLSLRGFVGRLEEDVAVDSNIESVSSWNLNRRLNVQVTARDLGTGLAQFLADGTRGGLTCGWVRERALALPLRNAEGRGEQAG
jgi:hypothetical protein